ncbi:hypothetical protein SARC_08845 [Sphaeroforma arctica JP610]|uniref:Neurotransmitter-gated ion-channel ligand-binding domain-containing protein n=1 Tax=Sphaeroforma arctica JP610 TaxID=667725 RepID=A0A0L0FRY7_9EUKA|nr:hypothetical protein SARC_08845 [Sphaeroforma arctica JP610]KNC78733.1 hypothetical protein SARC_08845 [Sphaeroforma arctica JP610]|eukprot:XP_014152635.1 hypothetical protein SARC_08845 [Sphaeroforma arctica JP610]
MTASDLIVPPRRLGLCIFFISYIAWLNSVYVLAAEPGAQPFEGQHLDDPPNNGSTTVWTSVFLDRILAVDQKNYRHEHSFYVSFTWYDDRALAQVEAATLERPGEECHNLCHPGFNQCCDSIWLPGVDITNVYDFPEGAAERFSIIVRNDSVTWFQIIHGTFYSTMDFRKFPFDRQLLVVEFASTYDTNLTFLPSQTGMLTNVAVDGDDVSGWTFEQIILLPWVLGDGQFDNDVGKVDYLAGAATDPAPAYGNHADAWAHNIADHKPESPTIEASNITDSTDVGQINVDASASHVGWLNTPQSTAPNKLRLRHTLHTQYSSNSYRSDPDAGVLGRMHDSFQGIRKDETKALKFVRKLDIATMVALLSGYGLVAVLVFTLPS